MGGIYFHIPFCRKACHYCSFHFSTSFKLKEQVLAAMCRDIEMKSKLLKGRYLQSIYFGGGTPSVLQKTELEILLGEVRKYFIWDSNTEICLEANPDDVNKPILEDWLDAGINRLSIGIQSFYDRDLQMMNRSHDSYQAHRALDGAFEAGFKNVSADLMFGLVSASTEDWKENLRILSTYPLTHISCYNLSIEEQTVFAYQKKNNKLLEKPEELQFEQFRFTHEYLSNKGWNHYEISNYAKPGFEAIHNQNYWSRVAYLGIGPSAHSFDGEIRGSNISNNTNYLRQIEANRVFDEKELLSEKEMYNECIMLGLRTAKGVSQKSIDDFSRQTRDHFHKMITVFLEKKIVSFEEGYYRLNPLEWFVSDHISEQLFI